MKSSKKQEIEITLVMNETEAHWLMGMLQNGHPDEDGADSRLREQFFNELKKSLTGYGVRK